MAALIGFAIGPAGIWMLISSDEILSIGAMPLALESIIDFTDGQLANYYDKSSILSHSLHIVSIYIMMYLLEVVANLMSVSINKS